MAHALNPPAVTSPLTRLIGGWLVPVLVLVTQAVLARAGLLPLWLPLWPLTVATAIWMSSDYRRPTAPVKRAA